MWVFGAENTELLRVAIQCFSFFFVGFLGVEGLISGVWGWFLGLELVFSWELVFSLVGVGFGEWFLSEVV